MKNILLIICCIISLSALGQTHFVEDNQEVRNWLDNMFQHLDKSKVPHGFLRDYAFIKISIMVVN